MSEYTVTLTEAERAAILEWLLNVDREAEYPGLYDRLAATPAAEPGALVRLEAWLSQRRRKGYLRSIELFHVKGEFCALPQDDMLNLSPGKGGTLAAAIDAVLKRAQEARP